MRVSLLAKRVRVACLRVSVWCRISVFLCVLFAVFVRVVFNVCGLLLAPYVDLLVFVARFCVLVCVCVFCV